MKESVVTTGRLGDSVAVATLVREKPLNSLLLDTIDQLAGFVDEALADPAISCLLLQSSTPRAFCAGADITALYRAIRGEEGLALSYAEAFFLREYTLDYRLHRSAKPVIAWGEGIVMGGGLGLLGGCSHRVGTASTRIAMPEITIGLFPDAGGTSFLSALPDHLGLWVGLTGCHLSAGDSLALGLLDHVVEDSARQALPDRLMSINWQAADVHEQISRALVSLETDEVLPLQLLRYRHEISKLMAESLAAEDFFLAFESGLAELPDDEWLAQAITTYRSGCPVTARIFLEQMRRAQGMSLADMFRMELTIAYQCIRHPDFPEGVRALLIDKDRNPAWSFPGAREVPWTLVEAHFSPSCSGDHPLKL